MMSDQIAAIILGAGKGTRMKSDLPKVMMPLAGKPMIRHPIDTLEQMGVKKIVVVTAPDGEMVRREAFRKNSSAPGMPSFPPKSR